MDMIFRSLSSEFAHMRRIIPATGFIAIVCGWLGAVGHAQLVGDTPVDDLAAVDVAPAVVDLPEPNTPWVTGRIDALLLWRSPAQAIPLYTNVATGATALDAADFGSPMAAGPRYAIFFNTSKSTSLEANYLRVQGFQSARGLPANGGKYQVANLGGQTWDTIDSVDGGYSSGLQSFELNARVPSGRGWQWLAGFRWLEWRENMVLSDTFSVGGISGTDLFNTTTCNALYGGQVGIDATVFDRGGPFTVASVVKAGVFGNAATQSSLYSTTEPPNTFTAGPFGQSRAATSFVGELGVTGEYRWSERISLRAGYTIFWISGLAMAPNQMPLQNLDIVDPAASTTAINVGGSVIAQGLTLGVEGRW